MYEKDLVSFGMNEKEAKLYLALLELEIATASEIAEKCGINRNAVFVTNR